LGYLNKDQYCDNDLYYYNLINKDILNNKDNLINKDILNNKDNLINNDNDILESNISKKIPSETDNLLSDEIFIVPYNENNILITKEDVINILKINKINISENKINNFEYIIQAFVHKSYSKKNIFSEDLLRITKEKINNPNLIDLFDRSNEKIKYIGDKVLKLAISTYLFFRYPELDEGFMTRLEIKLEDKSNFVIMSKELCLEKYFIISKQIETINGRNSDKLHEEIFESFIGALCLTCGFEVSLLLITNLLETIIDYSEKLYCDNNYKDFLLRIFHQKKWNYGPNYILLDSDGPSHKMKYIIGVKKPFYNIKATFNDQFLGYGIGFTKKKAEQNAAKMALILLGYLNKEQYNDMDIYYYYFYKEKLKKYLEIDTVIFTLIEEKNNKYIVEFKNENIPNGSCFGIDESLNEAEIKAAKMALILLGVITEYSSNDIYYYNSINNDKSINNDNFSEKSI